MKKQDSKRQNVQSTNEATDQHEKGKDFLSEDQIKEMLKLAKQTRYPKRNYLILLLMFRHGYRVSELLKTELVDVDLKRGRLWVRRSKEGLSTEQPLEGDEIRAIKQYLSTRKDKLKYLFISERNTPLTRQNINYLLNGIGEKMKVKINPHMLRHSCGYYLANKGYDLRLIQDYLGHRDPRHTVRYTRTCSARFNGLFTD